MTIALSVDVQTPESISYHPDTTTNTHNPDSLSVQLIGEDTGIVPARVIYAISVMGVEVLVVGLGGVGENPGVVVEIRVYRVGRLSYRWVASSYWTATTG